MKVTKEDGKTVITASKPSTEMEELKAEVTQYKAEITQLKTDVAQLKAGGKP